MVRTVTKRAKDAIIDAAQGVRNIAGDALGAATKAAADVVFESTANALEAGRSKIARAAPAMENALATTARRTVAKRKPVRRKARASRKAGAKRKAVAKHRAPRGRRSRKRAR